MGNQQQGVQSVREKFQLFDIQAMKFQEHIQMHFIAPRKFNHLSPQTICELVNQQIQQIFNNIECSISFRTVQNQNEKFQNFNSTKKQIKSGKCQLCGQLLSNHKTCKGGMMKGLYHFGRFMAINLVSWTRFLIIKITNYVSIIWVRIIQLLKAIERKLSEIQLLHQRRQLLHRLNNEYNQLSTKG